METFDRYSSKAPETLTSQLTNRASKEDAVKADKERQKINTKLFPNGKSFMVHFYQVVVTLLVSTFISTGKLYIERYLMLVRKISRSLPHKLTCWYFLLFFLVEEQNHLQESVQQTEMSSSKSSKKKRVGRNGKQPA